MLQLPESFLEEMRELLGGEYDAWEKSYEGNEGFRGLRVNTGKLRPEEFQALSAFSLRPVPWTRNGFYLEGQEQASKHPYYAAGLYYLQEPSAMTPAACLPIEAGSLRGSRRQGHGAGGKASRNRRSGSQRHQQFPGKSPA